MGDLCMKTDCNNIKRNDYIKSLILEYRRSNNKSILNEIIEYMLPFVCKISKKYSYLYNGDFDEAYINAQEGLFFAIQKYDASLSNDFFRYAYNYIYIYLLDNRFEISYFQNPLLISIVLKVKKMIESKYEIKLEESYENYNLMLDEIAELSLNLYFSKFRNSENTSRKYIQKKHIANILNIYNYLELNDDAICNYSLGEEENFIELIEKEELTECIEKNLSKLDPREERIIRAIYGFNEFEDKKSIQSIATEFNVSHQRITQIKQRALVKLKGQKTSGIIKRYL